MTKIKNTDELCSKILAPLIDYCEKNRGWGKKTSGLKTVCELFNKGLSDKIGMATISRWLKKDNGKTPSGGNLLRLIEVQIQIRGRDVENKPEPTMFCIANGHIPARDGFTCKECGCNL